MSSLAYYCKTVGDFLKELDNNTCIQELIAAVPPEEIQDRASEIDSWEYQ